jgi:EmrB/QacA subfamily drug resistance transporter
MAQLTTTSGAGARRIDPETVYRRRWWILTTLCLSLVIVVVANTALNVALPRLVHELDATENDLQWITDAYGLIFAGLLLAAGAMGDRFGRKGALQFGLTVFGLGSLASAFATSSTQLIVLRGVMGVGAAFIMPATLSILANVFPPQERPRAIAIWAGFAGAGGAIGPIVSGLLLNHYFWGSVFLVNVPLVALALVSGALLLPTSRDPNHGKLDPIGAAFSMLTLGALLYAIIEGPENGWGSPITLGSFAVFLVGLVAFIAWENHTDSPMLPMWFFKNRRFSVGASTITLTFFAMFGLFFVLTQYLQIVQGYSPLAAGLATLPLAIMLVLIAPRSAALVVKFGQHRVQAVGLTLVAVGMVVLSTLSPTSPYWLMAIGLAILGAGVACTTAPATNAIISSVPLSKSGVGSAVNDTTREVGGALGIAVLGSIVSSVFRSSMDGKVTGLPPELAAAANDNVGGAFFAASHLPGEAASRLITAASQAYTDAMHVATLAAAVVAVGAAVMVYFLFPRDPAPAFGGGAPGAGAHAAGDGAGDGVGRAAGDEAGETAGELG